MSKIVQGGQIEEKSRLSAKPDKFASGKENFPTISSSNAHKDVRTGGPGEPSLRRIRNLVKRKGKLTTLNTVKRE